MSVLAARPSISRKLTRMNLVVSGVALLTACLAFVVYDVFTFRDSAIRDLSTQAQIVGLNSVSALLFNDTDSAGKTLAALKAAPEIISARVYTKDRMLFASYSRDRIRDMTALPVVPADQEQVHSVTATSITLARRITFDGQPTGIVYIQSDLQAMYARVGRYGLIVAVVLVASLLAALLVSRLAQRDVSRPLIELADTARRVSEARDYSVRAANASRDDEVSVLIESFNEMLAQIQHRDASLEQAREELEERVRQRTAELEAMNTELEAFSYSVSHDLRAPLRHITGFATLLQRRSAAALDDQGRHYLDTMIDAATRMGHLIDDLLEFSRMGRASLTPRPVDLEQLVREAKAEVGADAQGRQILWELGPLPSVQADPALLRPVLVNLLSNAVKYTSTRPVARIEIGATQVDGQAIVHVRDNGVGFDMAYVDKLFGVFQRLHRSEEFSGTGIGLANVRRIIHRHGGRTWAEGEVDKGAIFYFSLPMAVRAISHQPPDAVLALT